MKFNKHNRSFILILIVVAVLTGIHVLGQVNNFSLSEELAALQGKWIKTKHSPKSEKASTPKNSNWKTYRNEKYGFELKYPKNFDINVKQSRPEEIKPGYEVYLTVSITDPKNQNINNITGEPVGGVSYLKIDVWGENSFTKDLFKGPFPKQFEANEVNGTQYIVERKINNIDGIEIFGSISEGHRYRDDFQFKKGGYVWILFLDPVSEGKITAEQWRYAGLEETDSKLRDQGTYDQILSTFKFTK
jgi:hypothetical protein